MKVNEFIEKLELALNSKTLYVKGGFGAPATAKNKQRYSTNYPYNINHASQIQSASADTFFFDCVCLVKGILWGWNADKNKVYGGATYGSNGVPDCSELGMINRCSDVSTDFTKITVGELMYMAGHVGIYVGNGKVIECTPAFRGGVQLTNVGNTNPTGYYHTWTKHGKLPWVDYSEGVEDKTEEKKEEVKTDDEVYTVVKGDTLWGIAIKKLGSGLKWNTIYEYNKLTTTMIRVGQKLLIPKGV